MIENKTIENYLPAKYEANKKIEIAEEIPTIISISFLENTLALKLTDGVELAFNIRVWIRQSRN